MWSPERLSVEKFTTTASPIADQRIWAEFWEPNNLDALQASIYTEAGKYGVCYAMVWPSPDRTRAIITGESPMLVHVRFDEENRGVPVAAVKVWQGRDDHTYATLYDDEGVYRFVSESKTTPTMTSTSSGGGYVYTPVPPKDEASTWQPRETGDADWAFENPMGQVPFRAFVTEPNLLGEHVSEIAAIIPIQDRINKTIFDRMVTQEFAAFPQRWVTGIEIPKDKNGNDLQPFDAAVDRLWTTESEVAQFGQFTAATLDGYMSAIEADVQALATQSRTPPHYLIAGMGQFPSGESVRATEYGLSRKIQNRELNHGESWCDLIRLAAVAVKDEELANDLGMEAVWKNVEARSEGEIVDALVKMGSLGVPNQALWERWGASPTEIARWSAANALELRAATAAAQPIQPPTQPPIGEPMPPAADAAELRDR